MKFSKLVRASQARGEDIIFVTEIEYNARDFQSVFECILSRSPFRLQDLYSFAYIVHFLGLDETIGRYLVPTNGITWRDVYYCLPALHLYLRMGYCETIATVFRNSKLPPEYCYFREIPANYDIFLKHLIQTRELLEEESRQLYR